MATPEEVEHLVRRTTEAQGLPFFADDEAGLAATAVIIGPAVFMLALGDPTTAP